MDCSRYRLPRYVQHGEFADGEGTYDWPLV
jgi:hypothetical protein